MSHSESLINSFLGILLEMAPYILLGFLIAGLLHVFMSRRMMTRHFSGNGWGPVVKAALFGIPLPLCSCGVLPTAVALRRSGASRGATTSFLIATPQTGVDSIAATWSLLGLPFAILRPLAALVGAVAGGCVTSAAISETDSDFEPQNEACVADECTAKRSFGARLLESVRYGFVDMVASVGKWLVIGLVVAALITVFVPQEFFVWLNRYPLLAMLGVLVVAIPMYICATGSIPIALSLMLKGLSPGCAFVLLMAGPAVNFASVLVLRKTQGSLATWIYLGAVVVTALAFGLIIDYLLPASLFVPPAGSVAGDCLAHFSVVQICCGALLAGLLIYVAIRPRHSVKGATTHNCGINHEKMTSQTFVIKGMNCAHCRASVEKAIAGVPGVESVKVTLSPGEATVTGDFDAGEIRRAVVAAGFDLG